LNDTVENDPRLYAIPDIHGHAKGEHKAFIDERPIPLSARMLFLWFYHACRRGWPRFLMVSDHMNYLTFEDPAAINLVRRALKLAQAGDLYGAAETASVEVGHAAVVSEGLRRGMRYSIGAEVDNDPRSRPDAQNIVDAMKPDGMIRSVHFLTIDHPTLGPNWNWPFDNPEFADVFDIVGTERTWELYMATLLDAVERLPGNIVGHFYVPAIFGHWPDAATLETYEDQIVAACETRGMAIEFNTRFLYRDHSDEQKAAYVAAHRRLLSKCKAKNVGIAIGSDAHSPKDQGRGFETVLALLDECEINELVYPIGGRLARVALRVERKPDAHAPVEPAAAHDERKAARRARPTESVAAIREDVPPPIEETDPAGTKSKPRPKRSRAKVAASVGGEQLDERIDVVDEAAFHIAPPPSPAEREAIAPVEPVDVAAPEPLGVDGSLPQLAAVEADEPASRAEPTDERTEPAARSTSDVDDDAAPSLDVATPALAVAASLVDVAPPSVDDSAPTADDAAVVGDDEPRLTPVAKPRSAAPRAKVASDAKAGAKKAARTGVKTSAKKAAAPAKKTATKKVAAKKAAPKKVTAKKAPAKKAAVRTTAAKKSAVKKTVTKKARPKKPQRRR
jgi:HisJ family histidinol phosphate phosphatase